MTDIDTALARLRDLPVDPRLDHLDDAVFGVLAARRAAASGPMIGIAAVDVKALRPAAIA